MQCPNRARDLSEKDEVYVHCKSKAGHTEKCDPGPTAVSGKPWQLGAWREYIALRIEGGKITFVPASEALMKDYLE